MGFILAAVVPDEERTAGATTPLRTDDASRARPLMSGIAINMGPLQGAGIRIFSEAKRG